MTKVVRLTIKKRDKNKICKIRKERDITTNFVQIKRLTIEYYEQLYANKLDNLEELGKFLGTHNLPRLNHDEILKI